MGKKEQEAFDRLPQWKKDKLLREKKRNSTCIENEPSTADETNSKEIKKEEDSLDNLPKWKRDKILREKQIAEEKARQEEQKKRELEQIRESIRKKIKNDTEDTEKSEVEKMDVDNVTIIDKALESNDTQDPIVDKEKEASTSDIDMV